jgi:Domain of unknown function (DUF4416)
MAEIRSPLPVKLFIGMISPEPALFNACADVLTAHYGPLDFESDVLPWNRTDYYRSEMGQELLRKFLFFSQLMDPGALPSIKHFTNSLERTYVVPAGLEVHRKINLDPGYVTEAKVVLATAKDFAHRIYIGEDIYAEVTLRYNTKERSFAPHEYTYPDYGSQTYLALFNRVRENLRTALSKKSRI